MHHNPNTLNKLLEGDKLLGKEEYYIPTRKKTQERIITNIYAPNNMASMDAITGRNGTEWRD